MKLSHRSVIILMKIQQTRFLFDVKNYKSENPKNITISHHNVILSHLNLENVFLQVLNAQAPVKKKIQRFNNNPFMIKQLRKAIMHRSRLKNVFKKSRTPKTWDSYKNQRNFCVNLLRKTKKEYFENINVKDINDNKKPWKTI